MRARRAAGRRGKTPRGACADSAHRRAADTPGDGSVRTPRHSRSARAHIVRRCRSAPRSTGSCRAGRSAAEAAPMPLPKHWTAPGKAGIKELPTRLPRRCATKARGSDANQSPGLLFGLLLRSIADEIPNAVAGLIPTLRSLGNRTAQCKALLPPTRQTALQMKSVEVKKSRDRTVPDEINQRQPTDNPKLGKAR